MVFPLSYYDLAVWNVVDQRWEVPEGADFQVYVGRSAFDEGSVQGQITADMLPSASDDIYAM